MGDAPPRGAVGAGGGTGAAPSEGPPVLDLVLVATVVALFALVGAVASGVERL